MINTNYSDVQTPQFRVLSDGQCHELYMAALECLNRVGVLVNQPEARELLASAGSRIDSNRVYIPPHIIQDAIASTPRTFTLWGREAGREIRIMMDRVHFGPGPTCNYFYDPETRERRHARRGDPGMVARVCDALDNLDYVMSLSLLGDVTPVLSPVYEFAEMITNTTKPIVAWANDPATLSDIYQIAVAVAGSKTALRHKPNFAFFATYESPLRHSKDPLENMFWAAEHDIPIVYIGGPTVGLESPVTGASALMLHLAAALSGLAIVQLKRRGAPMIIGGLPSAMDLRTARPAYSSPESMLHTAAAVDMARYLDIPFMGTAGASESKLLDSQAGIEISLQLMMSSLSGASLVHDVGFLDCADIGSLELLVMADEVIAMIKRIMRGILVNPATLMLDLVEKVGPSGYFLKEPRSSSLCRSEIWVPRLMDRNAYAIWEKNGSKSMEDRVHEKLSQILSSHQPPELPTGVEDKIHSILTRAEARYHPEN
jgi:trimethylamine--corrinoid protein Co-methyltransferase